MQNIHGQPGFNPSETKMPNANLITGQYLATLGGIKRISSSAGNSIAIGHSTEVIGKTD